MRHGVWGLLLTFIIFFSTIGVAGAEPNIQGEAGILMDATTGQVLWEKNAHKQMYPASTTKIMTTLLVLELGNLDEIVVVSRNARNQIGSRIYLEEGEEILVRDLLYGIMLSSGNDAAVVAAEYISGSAEEFAELMNSRAVALGALNTNFINPNGLHHDDHYSTAYDLAVISRHALALPQFREIVQTSNTHIPWPTEQWDRRLDSGNRLLTRYQGANGIKTGYTSQAKGTFVSSANRDGFEMIAVTLSSGQIFDDAAAILDYGYDNFKKQLIIADEQPVTLAPVRYGDRVQVLNLGEVYYTGPKDKALDIYIAPVLKDLEAPVKSGVLAGYLEVSVNGELISTVPLVTIHPVERKITTYWWFYAGVLIAVYLPLRINIHLRRRRKKNRYMKRKRYYEQSF
jgi:D-alanyl-D-alanine carboxypeptidase (penicillin-binding protein 5/6)